MNRRRVIIAIVSLVALIVAWKSTFIVRPDQVVVVTKFGDPIDEKREPGLYFLAPFLEDARYLDSRVRGWDDVARNTNTAELKPIDFTVFARWQIDPSPGGPTRFYTAVGNDARAKSNMNSVVTKRIQAAIREHRLASIVRDKGRRFVARAASDLKFLFVDYPECQPGSNAEIKGMLDEYDEIASRAIGETTMDAQALRSEIVGGILESANETLIKDFGIDILDLHFKYLNYSPQVHAEITNKITKDRGRDIARYNKLGNTCTGTIKRVMEQVLGTIVGEQDRRVRELRGQGIAQSIAIKADAFNSNPGFFRFLKILELYERSLTKNTRFVLSANNPLLVLMRDPSLIRAVAKRKLSKRAGPKKPAPKKPELKKPALKKPAPKKPAPKKPAVAP
jgi:membrane protease subunit HflC